MKLLKPIKTVSILNRKMEDPGKLTFTGEDDSRGIDVQLFTYNQKECKEDVGIPWDSIETLEEDGNSYWLNIYGLHETESIAGICAKQDIHSLVIQDILDINQRPKFQEYHRFSFLTLKSIAPSHEGVIAEQISFVLGANYLISFQERQADFFDHIRLRLREDRGDIRERGTDFLLYTLLESILDNYFKTLSKLDVEIEHFNFVDANKDFSPKVLATIESYKRFVYFIRKSILPIKEFTVLVERGELQFIEDRNVKYYMEIKDLCLMVIDSSDMLLSSLESSANLFFSMQGHRTNQVMKTLTVVATIFIPLTFLAGVYGMNFTHMPELHWQYGYLAIWMVFISLFIGMVLYFWKKRWF